MKIVPKAPGNGPIGAAYRNRPDLALGLELKRGMKRVLLEEPILFVGYLLDCMGQAGVELAKARRHEGAERCHLDL